jgi:carbamoyltransferase
MEYGLFQLLQGLTWTDPRFHALFGGPPRDPESMLEQRHMDWLRSIQAVTEEVLLRMARNAHHETGMQIWCLGLGGVARELR